MNLALYAEFQTKITAADVGPPTRPIRAVGPSHPPAGKRLFGADGRPRLEGIIVVRESDLRLCADDCVVGLSRRGTEVATMVSVKKL